MFNDDAAFGKKYERLCPQIFHNKRYEIAEGNFPYWDVKLIYDDESGEEVEVTLECKSDRYAQRTKQIAIEYSYDGRPSGIEKTTADYWVHYIDGTNRYYLIPIEYLRKMIAEERWFDKKRAGDGYKSRIYIMDEELFADFADTYPDGLL